MHILVLMVLVGLASVECTVDTCQQQDLRALYVQLVSTNKNVSDVKTMTVAVRNELMKEIQGIYDTLNNRNFTPSNSEISPRLTDLEKNVTDIKTLLNNILNSADGGWTSWSSWTKCTVSCNGGLISRSRTCSNPTPSQFGRGCVGNDIELSLCNTRTCPDVDECLSMPCKNEGTCVDEMFSYRCLCQSGYTGANCEIVTPDGLETACNRTSSSLYCNCTVECPFAADELMCADCVNGYSNVFITIPSKSLIGFNLVDKVVSSREECQQLCISTTGCVSFEFQTAQNRCFLNAQTAGTKRERFTADGDYDYFFRKCRC